jgi:hypothetical protein
MRSRAAFSRLFTTLNCRGLRRGSSSIGKGLGAGQCCDCVEQSQPVASSGDADVLEDVVRQPRQQVRVDLVVSEIRLVLAEPETAKPPADIHGRAPHGLQDNP